MQVESVGGLFARRMRASACAYSIVKMRQLGRKR